MFEKLVVQMELVPPYLAAYLWQIRKHSGENGYLKRRLEDKDPASAVYEKSMLAELLELHLIAVSDNEDDVVFNPHVTQRPDGVVEVRGGTEQRVPVPRCFIVLARGHYLWTEYVFAGGRWLLTAFLGALIALLVSA